MQLPLDTAALVPRQHERRSDAAAFMIRYRKSPELPIDRIHPAAAIAQQKRPVVLGFAPR